MQKTPIIQQLLSILKTAPTKEQALRQMSMLFEQDEALANTLASALLIHTLERQEIYPLLGLEPLTMSTCIGSGLLCASAIDWTWLEAVRGA